MKTYGVSGKVNKVSGFGWAGFMVNGAKYTGTLTLQGTKKAFDAVSGALTYAFVLKSVKAWGMDITKFVVSQLGGKSSAAGQVVVNGSTFAGMVSTPEGYNVAYRAMMSNVWKDIAAAVDVTNKAVANTTAKAAMTKDDGVYDPEPVNPPEPPNPPTPGPLGELTDPPLTKAEVDGNADFEDYGIEGRFKIPFRGHTKRPSVNEYWSLSTPFLTGEGDQQRPTIYEEDGNVVCPDRPYRGVIFHCTGWCNVEPPKHDLNPKLDYVGDRAPRGVKHAIIECHKPKV